MVASILANATDASGRTILFVTRRSPGMGIIVFGKEKLLMAKTLTGADVKRTASSKNTAPARDRAKRRRQKGRLILMLAPMALAAASGAAFLAARRFLNSNDRDRRLV